jgi:hypothetical protein
MVLVDDIYEEAKNIVSGCDDTTTFRFLTRAVELLANKGDFDPLQGVIEIQAQDGRVTLPNDIETPQAVNIDGRPTIGRDVWFNFHINGPGDYPDPRTWSCPWRWWKDGAQRPVFRDFNSPSRLVAVAKRPSDENIALWAYGYDENGDVVRTQEGLEWVDGYRVPVLDVYTAPSTSAPVFSRITRIKKAMTDGAITLHAVDDDGPIIVGVYQSAETEPLYRSIEVPTRAVTAKIAFRRRIFRIRSRDDIIPLHSELAVLMALRAVKAYHDDDVMLGSAHEATAARILKEKQDSVTPPVPFPIQVSGQNMLVDQTDYID